MKGNRHGSVRFVAVATALGLVAGACTPGGAGSADSTAPSEIVEAVGQPNPPDDGPNGAVVGQGDPGSVGETPTTVATGEVLPPSTEELDAFFAGLAEPLDPLTVPAPAQLQTFILDARRPAPVFDDVIATDEGGGLGARIRWEVADRYDSSWDAHGLWWGYEDNAGPAGEDLAWLGYDPSFVQPERWQLVLNGCDSQAPAPITSYQWAVDGALLAGLAGDRCLTADVFVPSEGTYRVTLTVTTADGWQSTTSGTISVDDILIASLGDSSASGEGNPDSGSATIVVSWKYDACHRSARSSHARVAEAIEGNDSHTSVTFLSFACSGATIGNVLGPYRGMAPDDSSWLNNGRSMPAQVEALARSLCADPSAAVGECPAGMMREVDVLLLQVGLNDAHFEPILFACMNYPEWLINAMEDLFSTEVMNNLRIYFSDVEGRLWDIADALLDRPEPCHENINLVSKFGDDVYGMDSFLETVLSGQPWYEGNTFGAIRRRLDELGVHAGQVVVVTYPGPWGRSDGDVERGCGVFSLVNEGEAEWMHQDAALFLNQQLELEAVRNGWWSVPALGGEDGPPGLVDRFQRHGYCAGIMIATSDGEAIVGDGSYFVAFSESLMRQFNIKGTIHPNSLGHSQTAQAIIDTLAAPKPDREPDKRVTIVFDSLRLSGADLPVELIGSDGLVALDFGVLATPAEPWLSTTPTPERLGDWPVGILWRAAEARSLVRARPDTWTSLPRALTVTVDLAPSDLLWLWAGSPDPAFVVIDNQDEGSVIGTTMSLRLESDPRLADIYDLLTEPSPREGDPFRDGYTAGGVLNIQQIFSRFSNGTVSYGAGNYTTRTTSSPGYLDIRYCIFVGDIPRGVPRPGSETFLDCEVRATDG